ncbi:MAG: hypothetical protein N2691_02300 [Patescibacteria group bacterium]|nr:hypothetical protein [Patescibacteria group bacterium]
MSKKTVLPGFFALCFLFSALFFWYTVFRLYQKPFSWTDFNSVFNSSLLLTGMSWVCMLTCAAVLAVLKPDPALTKVLFIVSAASQWTMIPFSVLGVIAAIIFFVAFAAGERNARCLFHNSIKINFWEPFSRSIPLVVSLLSCTVAFVVYDGSRRNIDSFRISIPRGVIENAVNTVLSPQVKGQMTALPVDEIAEETLAMARIREPETPREPGVSLSPTPLAVLPDDEIYASGFDVDRFIANQLQRFGVTDPAQQEFVKEMVKQRIAATIRSASGDVVSESLPQLQTTGNPALPIQPPLESMLPGDSLMGTIQSFDEGLNDSYRQYMFEQAQTVLESQLNGMVRQYKPVIPVLNTLSIFFLLSVLHFPVLYGSLFFLTGILNLLRTLKVFTVVTVKMDVERLAW